MPIHTADVTLPIRDPFTLRFMQDCMAHWKDADVCTDAHVESMKHLVRAIFGLPHAMELVGMLFEDRTLAMLHPDALRTFYALTLRPDGVWTAARVGIEGFDACWGVEDAGFWDGLAMADSATVGEESKGPAEEDA